VLAVDRVLVRELGRVDDVEPRVSHHGDDGVDREAACPGGTRHMAELEHRDGLHQIEQ
jgi:hypothetical protein